MTRAERLRIEAMGRELQRTQAWLRTIAVRARGMGRAMAVRCIHSNDWPDEVSSGRGGKNNG